MFAQGVTIDVQPAAEGTSLPLKLKLYPNLADVSMCSSVGFEVGHIVRILTDSDVKGV